MINQPLRKKATRLPFRFNPKKLKAGLLSIPENEWTEVQTPWALPGSVFGIDLFVVDLANTIPTVSTAFKPGPALERNAYLQEVLGTFKCKILKARLNRLRAGAFISPHTDAYGYRTGEVRVHIPIVTNDLFRFNFDNESWHMKEGECWYVETTERHGVTNNGAEDRTHLVMDLRVNDWLEDIFRQHGFPAMPK
ncbi:MAG: aspartyl/asparaginyl beta-hydroxylase domain-containing protein [Bacteroidota bacterium]